ncbi:MAG: flavin monoamine oxidase family protein [Gammaproteobacteria bacterium]
MHANVLVIGAGFSGLAAARAVSRENQSVVVLEARDRVGGRALSQTVGAAAFDLGPAWVWPQYQPRIAALIDEFGAELVPQFETGDFLFETHTGLQRGDYPKRYLDARRVRGGLQSLAQAMAGTLPHQALRYGETVAEVHVAKTQVEVKTRSVTYTCRKLICAAPGPLMSQWLFQPALPQNLVNALQRWPTWMAAQAKIIAVYDKPFWRDNGLSGAAASHIGPLVETADQSDIDHGLYALFGFLGWPAQERARQKAQLEQAVMDQLVRLFGQHAAQPDAFYLQDWALESLTAAPSDLNAAAGHPPYGEPAWSQDWFDGRVFFAGAESADTHGGLIEGALNAGERAAAAVCFTS